MHPEEGEMLLVRDSVTREVVVLGPETIAEDATAPRRGSRILPVVKAGRLVGLIFDRSPRSRETGTEDAGSDAGSDAGRT